MRLARSLLAIGDRQWAIGSASGARITRSGCWSSTPRRGSARFSSISTPPSHAGDSLRPGTVAMPATFASTSYKTSDYVAMIRDRATTRLDARTGRVPRNRELGDLLTADGGVHNDALLRREQAAVRRPGQHSVHKCNDGIPEGRDPEVNHNILNNGYFVGEGCRYTRWTGLHPRAVLSLLRHGARQPRLHDAWRGNDRPRSHLRRRDDTANRPGRALHESYGVPTMFIAYLPDFNRYDLSVLTAHRTTAVRRVRFRS